jgi:hypothetical protein
MLMRARENRFSNTSFKIGLGGYPANLHHHWLASGSDRDYFGPCQKWGSSMAVMRAKVVQDGTGKAPELAKTFVGAGRFLLTYGDILVKPETYRQMLQPVWRRRLSRVCSP